MKRTALSALLSALAFSLLVPVSIAGQNVIWVGADPVLCDNDNLPTAVAAAPGGSIIRIANDQSYTDLALEIASKPLAIEGGFANCLDPEPVAMTQLRGTPDQLGYVLTVIGGMDKFVSYSFHFSNLELRAGEDDSGGGGGLRVIGEAWVTLENVDILGHRANTDGAGVRILGAGWADTRITLNNVNVGPTVNVAFMRNQTTGNGGGVYCENARIDVVLASIQHNQATNQGGGVWMENCRLRYLRSGFVNHVSNNRSLGDGGGFFLIDSELRLDDTLAFQGTLSPIPSYLAIMNNYAGDDGGAISASGSTIELYDSPIVGNEAEWGSGGAMYMSNGSQASLLGRQPAGNHCNDPVPLCSMLANNSAEFNSTVALFQASSLIVDRTWIHGNLSTEATGPIIRATGAGTQARVFNSLIADNGPTSWIVIAHLGGSVLLSQTTIAGNIYGSDTFRVSDVGSLLQLENSIVWQPGQDLFGGNGAMSTSCSNAHDNSADPGLETHDPGFVDPSSGNYRLQLSSANVDRCEAPAAVMPPVEDLDGTPRPQNLTNPPSETWWDRGAFELTDLLFQDRFEEY